MIYNVTHQNFENLFSLNKDNLYSIEESTLSLLKALQKEIQENGDDLAISKEISELFSSDMEQSIYEDYINISKDEETLLTYLGKNTSTFEALNLYLKKHPEHVFYILSTEQHMSKLPDLYSINYGDTTAILSRLPISVDMISRNLLNEELDNNLFIFKHHNFEKFFDSFTDEDNNQNYLKAFKEAIDIDIIFPSTQIEPYLLANFNKDLRDEKPQDLLVYIICCSQHKNKSLLQYITHLNQVILKEVKKKGVSSLTSQEIESITKKNIPVELYDSYTCVLDFFHSFKFDDTYFYPKQFNHNNTSEEFLIHLFYPHLEEKDKNLTLSRFFSRIYNLPLDFSLFIPEDIVIKISKDDLSNDTTFFKSIAHHHIVEKYTKPIFKVSKLLQSNNPYKQDIIDILSKFFDKEERNNFAEHLASFKTSIDYNKETFPHQFLELFKEVISLNKNNMIFSYSLIQILDKALFQFTVLNQEDGKFDFKKYFTHEQTFLFINKLLPFRHNDNQHAFSLYIKENFSSKNPKEVETVKNILMKSCINIEEIPNEFFYEQPIFNILIDKLSWTDKKKLPHLNIFPPDTESRKKLQQLIDNAPRYQHGKNPESPIDFLLNINTDFLSYLSPEEKRDINTWNILFKETENLNNFSLPLFIKECQYILEHEMNNLFDIVIENTTFKDKISLLKVFPTSFLNRTDNLLKLAHQNDEVMTTAFLTEFNEKLLYSLMEFKNSGKYNFNNINDTLLFVIEDYILQNSCSINNVKNKPVKF